MPLPSPRARIGRRAPRLAPVGLVSACALLAACGSSTKTTEKTTPPTPVAEAAGSTATSTTAAATHATAASGQGTGGTLAGASTRTAAAPGFVHEETASAELASAIAVLRQHGYAPNDTSQYHAGQTLRVLVGTRSPTGDGYGQQAFFFVGGRYIGTDAAQPSATIAVVSQSDTEVTLAYPRYRPGDPLCCAHGGKAQVRFALNNGRLTPLDPIPPLSVRR
jgi:hypothetical protein